MLGVARVEFLPYHDSGMAGEPTNDAAGAFAAADVDEAASALADDPPRGAAPTCSPPTTSAAATGTPTTSRCTDVGRARRRARRHATRLRGDDRASEHFLSLARAPRRRGARRARRPRPRGARPRRAEARITTHVDVAAALDRKRAAMAAHPSQIADDSFFLALADDAFRRAFGTEWFIRLDDDAAEPETLDPRLELRPARVGRRRPRPQSRPAGSASDRSDDHGAYGAITNPARPSSGTS